MKRHPGLTIATMLIGCLCATPSAAREFDSCSGERILAAAPRLMPCPDKPNCVSTEAIDPDRKIAPITVNGDLTSIRERLLAAIALQSGSRIAIASERFIVATFRSRLFGFIDEAQFLIEPNEHRVRLRSGACSGYFDFGVNRRRIEAIEDKLAR